jgi:predicted negative regulator of RcsB-dependent stress response
MSTRLIGRHQNNATYLDTHAWVLYVRKEYDEARKYLEKAMQDTLNVNGTIIEHYGDVLFKLGHKEKALEQWKKAKSKGDTSDIINRKIETGILHEK